MGENRPPMQSIHPYSQSHRFFKHWRLHTCSQEPRFNDKAELRGRALILDHLNSVVPAHTTLGGSAAHEDNFALIFSSSSDHDYLCLNKRNVGKRKEREVPVDPRIL
jgi:hypothetical protein